MVVDTSALAAIVFGEDDAERYAFALEGAEHIHISAATWVEAQIVVEARQGEPAWQDLHILVHRSGASVLPLDQPQAEAAWRAWRRFGKGRHTAGLNLGDCFAYALAATYDEPLLFKGDDFTATDIRSALG